MLLNPADQADNYRLSIGAYGVVCSAKSRVTGESVAIKKVKFPHLPQPWMLELWPDELIASHTLGHQSVSQEDIDETSVTGTQVSRSLTLIEWKQVSRTDDAWE